MGFYVALGPLLLAAVVGAAYGIRWAAPYGLWLYLTIYQLYAMRGATWPRRHLALAFALNLMSFSAVLLCFVTFVVIQFGGPPAKLPAWGSLSIALALGTAATGALWPAQRRYYGVGSEPLAEESD